MSCKQELNSVIPDLRENLPWTALESWRFTSSPNSNSVYRQRLQETGVFLGPLNSIPARI